MSESKGLIEPVFEIHVYWYLSKLQTVIIYTLLSSYMMDKRCTFLIEPLFMSPQFCLQTVKALMRLQYVSASLSEPSLIAYVKNI